MIYLLHDLGLRSSSLSIDDLSSKRTITILSLNLLLGFLNKSLQLIQRDILPDKKRKQVFYRDICVLRKKEDECKKRVVKGEKVNGDLSSQNCVIVIQCIIVVKPLKM